MSEEQNSSMSEEQNSSAKIRKKIYYNAKLGLAEQKGYSKITSMEGQPRPEQVDAFVATLMADETLDIAQLPEFLKEAVYRLVTGQLLSLFLNNFYHGATGAKLMGHHIDLYFSELDTDAIDSRKLERYGKVRKPLATDHIDELVSRIVDRNEINVGVLPDFVERALYTKVLYVTIHLIQTMLKCTEVDFCGYAFKVDFDMVESTGDVPQIVRNDLGDSFPHEVNPAIIDEYVEEALRGHEGLKAGLENTLEKPIFSAVYKLAMYALHETLKTLKLSVMGDNFRMRIVPGEPGSNGPYERKGGMEGGKEGAKDGGKQKPRRFSTTWMKRRLSMSSLDEEANSDGLFGLGIFTLSSKKRGERKEKERREKGKNKRTPVKARLVSTQSQGGAKSTNSLISSPDEEANSGGLFGLGTFTLSSKKRGERKEKEKEENEEKERKEENEEKEIEKENGGGEKQYYRTPVKAKLASPYSKISTKSTNSQTMSSDDDADSKLPGVNPRKEDFQGLELWYDASPTEPFDDEKGIAITWRNVEGETLQHYLDSYRPPRTVPYSEKLQVREEQVYTFTMSVLEKGDYHIPGVPVEAEIFLYKAVIRAGLQSFLTIFHDTVRKTRLFGHHLQLDIEEGTRPFAFVSKPTNLKAVKVLVDTLLDDEEVNLSLLPDFVERKLYTNVILMCLLLVQNVCESSCMDFVGHSLRSKFAPLNEAVTKTLRDKIRQDALVSEVPDSKVDQEALRYCVEKEKEESNELNKLLYSSVYRISLYVAREVLLDINVNVLEDGYLMRLAPGDPGDPGDPKG